MLRMEKIQNLYQKWIQELEKEYPVEINKEKLKTFLIDIQKRKGDENEN